MSTTVHNIHFDKQKRTLMACGRNRLSKVTGIELYSRQDKITQITPINSKGTVTEGCYIEVPTETIALLLVSKEIMRNKNILPLLIGLHPILDKCIERNLKRKATQ